MSRMRMLLGAGLGVLIVVVVLLVALDSDDGSERAGGGVAVARVGGASIGERDLNSFLRLSAASRIAVGRRGVPFLPGQPSFRGCRLEASRLEPTEAVARSLEQACGKAGFDALVVQAMSFLIQKAWFGEYAEREGIEVSGSAVEDRLALIRRQTFDGRDEYRAFLRSSGQDQEAIDEAVRTLLVQERVRQRVADVDKRVSAEQVAAYYRDNPRSFRGQSLEEARPVARQLIVAERQRKAFEGFQRRLEREQKRRTVCLKRYTVPSCGKTITEGDAVDA